MVQSYSTSTDLPCPEVLPFAVRLIWCSRRYQEMLAWWKRSPGLGREIPGATLPICPSVGTPRRLAMAFVLVHIRQVQCMIFMLHGFPRINLVFSKDACTLSSRKTQSLSSCERNSTCLAPGKFESWNTFHVLQQCAEVICQCCKRHKDG